MYAGLLSAVIAILTLTIAPLSAQSPKSEQPSARERLEAMSAKEKEALAAKRERFEQLPEAEQQRIRELDRKLSADPDEEQLRGVMSRYYEWLKTLSSDERATLLSKTGEERIEMIRIQLFRSMADRRLPQEDLEIVHEWTKTYFRSRESQMIEKLPIHEREKIEQIEDEAARWRSLFWQIRRREIPPMSPPSPEEISVLVNDLSSDAQQIFAAAPNDDKRRELVQSWIRAAMHSRFQQSVSEEELMKFLQEELDPKERARIESLPREEMQKELRRRYFEFKFRGPGGPPRFGPGGPRGRGDGRPPGDEWRGDRDRDDRSREDRNGDDRGRPPFERNGPDADRRPPPPPPPFEPNDPPLEPTGTDSPAEPQ